MFEMLLMVCLDLEVGRRCSVELLPGEGVRERCLQAAPVIEQNTLQMLVQQGEKRPEVRAICQPVHSDL